MNKVLVVGSINMDMVFTTASFPAPGETLSGQRFNTFHGGKGANQAVAARRLGAEVAMIGCVGADAFGRELIAQLAAEGIDTRRVRTCAETRSGVAAITVCRAENTIIVVPGANHTLTIDDVFAADADFAAADVILSQLEIPLAVVEAAAGLAALHGKPFLLNPAPAVTLPPQLLEQVALLTPNEHELGLVFPDGAADWASTLSRWPQRIIMTHGADGAWFADADGVLRHQAGFSVPAVDTTGAGDTFNGALAAFWGQDLASSARLACAAAARSVTRAGARDGMPTLAEVQTFLAGQPESGR